MNVSIEALLADAKFLVGRLKVCYYARYRMIQGHSSEFGRQ